MSVAWEPREPQPEPTHTRPLDACRAILIAVIGGVVAWSLILGLGFLGYRLGQLV
jgi:hypothetical protein